MHSVNSDVPLLKPEPHIAILLCTFDGQSYLREQLESIANQTFRNWCVWASDDASADATRTILHDYSVIWQCSKERLRVQSGPTEGFVTNFLSLICNRGIIADYYALADQDDIWEKNKLERAVEWLQTVPAGIPALYCSRTCLVDVKNKHIGFSPLFKKTPCFANALAQNLAGGNTMVFNEAARNLLVQAGHDVDVVAHDWWAYLLVTGCGGVVYYDSVPTLRYRQHQSNLIGMNASWRACLQRLSNIWKGRMSEWNDKNIRGLVRVRDILTPENQWILDEFAKARVANLPFRVIYLKRSGVYRQTLFGNFGFLLAAVFKKI